MRGEFGWSFFAESEVKCIVDWLRRIVYEVSQVSDIGIACHILASCMTNLSKYHIVFPSTQIASLWRSIGGSQGRTGPGRGEEFPPGLLLN